MLAVQELYDSSTVLDIQAAADLSLIPKILYSRKESAYALTVSIRSLDLILASGEMKFRRVGRKVLIPRESLEQYAKRDHQHLTQHPGRVQ
jgi:excisionase family DNA binding protein